MLLDAEMVLLMDLLWYFEGPTKGYEVNVNRAPIKVVFQDRPHFRSACMACIPLCMQPLCKQGLARAGPVGFVITKRTKTKTCANHTLSTFASSKCLPDDQADLDVQMGTRVLADIPNILEMSKKLPW